MFGLWLSVTWAQRLRYEPLQPGFDMTLQSVHPLSIFAVWWNQVTGRRGHPRQAIHSRPGGELHLYEIVSVQWLNTSEVSVLSKEEPREGEVFSIYLPARRAWMGAQVLSSTAVLQDGLPRHSVRLRLGATDRVWTADTASDSPAWRTEGDPAVEAVIGKTLPVRLLNIGLSGCLLEASHQLRVPAVGEVSLRSRGRMHVDLVRVCWAAAEVSATHSWHVGAEFIAMETQRASLRGALSAIVEAPARVPGMALVPPRSEAPDSEDVSGPESQERMWTACEYAAR